MSSGITQEDNLVLQSYATLSLLAELHNNKLLDSAFFEGMTFGAPWVKEQLRTIGVDNQGCAMIALYAMLVLPREVVQEAHATEYDAINVWLATNTQNTTTNYQSDNTTVNFIRHIRNAVSHARVAFRPNDVIIFEDENTRRHQSFSTELPLQHLGEFFTRLQAVHLAYIKKMNHHGQ